MKPSRTPPADKSVPADRRSFQDRRLDERQHSAVAQSHHQKGRTEDPAIDRLHDNHRGRNSNRHVESEHAGEPSTPIDPLPEERGIPELGEGKRRRHEPNRHGIEPAFGQEWAEKGEHHAENTEVAGVKRACLF